MGRSWCSVLVCGLVLLASAARAASLYDGKLQVAPETRKVAAGGTVSLRLSFTPRGMPSQVQRVVDGRAVTAVLAPYRFNLRHPEPAALALQRTAPDAVEVTIPAATPPGWYRVICQAAPAADEPAPAAPALEPDNPLAGEALLGVFDPAGGLAVRLATERARCVFCPGEVVRVLVSARGKAGGTGPVAVTLTPDGGAPVTVARGTLTAAPGREVTLAFDLDAARTAAWAPGAYTLAVAFNGKDTDRYPIQIVSPARSDARARWWHGLPYGNGSGYNANPATPGWVARQARWIDNEALGVHHANFWVQMFGGAAPILGPAQELPGADDPEMPPAAAEYCPSATHALYQLLLARGVSLGVMLGYTEAGSENYMPLPTVFTDQMDTIARKYLMGSLALAQYPHFVGVYTDAYAKPDWHGGGEMTEAQATAVRETLFRDACAYAGLKPVAPYRFGDDKTPFDSEINSKNIRLNGEQQKAFNAYLTATADARFHGSLAEMAGAPAAAKLAIWQGAWKAAGIDPAPEPKTRFPFPKPNGMDDAAANPTAFYKYTEYVQRGLERCYADTTRTLEGQLPAVFTMQNRNRENHWTIPYAWDWSRSPSVPAEYSRGCTVVACSEWNLDGEPQPYLTTTEVNRTLLDEGRPVWRTASFHFNGSQSRFLRDAVFLAGRGVTPFYATPESASWSHKGTDQSTYAARDRLAGVSAFLTTYEGLFDALQPVKEVGIYLRPGWGDPNAGALNVALPCALMTGHQAHVVTHADLAKGGLAPYRILLAPGLTRPNGYAFEDAAMQAFVAKGGAIIGAPAPTDYYTRDGANPAAFGITAEQQPVLNKDGSPRIDGATGKPEMKTQYTETLEARAKLTKAHVWKAFPTATVMPIDFGEQWAYREADGTKKSYSSRAHWTGFQLWGNVQPPALANAAVLKAAFDHVQAPLVEKDQPEVFVCVQRPRDAKAQGTYLFVANFTLPDDPAWTQPRVPYFFWPTYAKPCVCTLRVKDDGIGAVYDLMTGAAVPFTREAGRVVFKADMRALEGRVFACFPKAVTGAALQLPATAAPGARLAGRFMLQADGAAMPVLGAVRLRVTDADGRVLLDVNRALPADGALPVFTAPLRGPLTVQAVDTVTGLAATATVAVAEAPPAPAAPADPVTVFRGDVVHRFLTAKGAPLRIMVTEGREAFVTRKVTEEVEDENGDTTTREVTKAIREITPENRNADVERERTWAQALQRALQAAGVPCTVVSSNEAVVGPLFAHPWQGKEAFVRDTHTVPNRRIDGPVILVGSARSNPYLQDLERACVAPRSFGRGNAANGRAVVAYLARAFSPQSDALALVADDDAGMQAAIRRVAELARTAPDADPYYTAREHLRYAWLPADVARFKAQQGLADPAPAVAAPAAPVATAATRGGWAGGAAALGPHVFTLDASAGGVAVGLTSQATPLVLVSADGKTARAFGGKAEVWARDVAVSADGQVAMAGFGLGGLVSGYAAKGTRLWQHTAGILYKDDAFAWETFKDSERFLTVSPDHTRVIAAAGKEGFVAHDANTGRVLWTFPVETDPARPRGPIAAEMPWSPDGRYALVYTNAKVGDEYVSEDCLVDAATGKPVWTAPRDVSDWELYAAVGPQDAWTITAGRSSTFALRDEQGVALRVVKPEQLPSALAAEHGMIPPTVLAGLRADRVVLTKGESQAIFVMAVRLGAPAQRAAARAALRENTENAKLLYAELSGKSNPDKWTPEYIKAFMAGIVGPVQAKKLVADKMARFASEKRAGRKRDYRWISDDFALFKQLQYEEDREIIEAAADLDVVQSIALPAPLCAATIDPAMQTVYAALWDGTVRAYNVETGTPRWVARVNGGCQLALSGSALYAGGSRGDLYRLQAETGAVSWQRRLDAVE